ncbi:MAG: DUF2784 domain-containing protein [Acidobacteriota bacterium]|nr:MAG: DUF2784 domain-containing protein [Acidobacteriota bacterium]
MLYSLAADLTVGLHLFFVLFVLFGGLCVVRWPKAVFVHIPSVFWAALVELAGWICPLTPLEVRFRRMAGEAGYEGDFLARYLVPVLYPEGLNREVQVLLGIGVVLLNIGIYTWVLRRR